MHMTCQPPGGCSHEFCWICMGSWNGHTTCNKYGEKENNSADDGVKDLQRYAHYFKRFHEHEKAQHYANVQQREFINTLINKRAIKVKDVEFLDTVVNEIVASRRFLKWTYAYAYISGTASKVHSQQLFEFQQSQLEETLEGLSHVMETAPWSKYLDLAPSLAQDFYTTRHEVLSLLTVVRKSFNSLTLVLREDRT